MPGIYAIKSNIGSHSLMGGLRCTFVESMFDGRKTVTRAAFRLKGAVRDLEGVATSALLGQ